MAFTEPGVVITDDQGNPIAQSTPPAPNGYTAPGQQLNSTQQPSNIRYFTEEDINRARTEERDKLYGQRETERTELARLKAEQTAREAKEAQIAQELELTQEANRRAIEEQEMDAKTLIARREAEWEARFKDTESRFQRELDQRDAIMAKEAEFQQLQTYKAQAVAANADMILPELAQWIQGNSQAEVDAAVARAIETTNSVLGNLRQVNDEQVRLAPGVPARAPALGPEAFVAGQRQLSQQDIADMPMADWAKIRGQLGPGRGGAQGRGMFD